MKILKETNIFGRIYRTIFKNNIVDVSRNSDTILWGEMDPENREIKIYSELSEYDKFETYIHELLHACIYESAIRDSVEDEERVVDILTKTIADMLIRNNMLK